MSDPSAVELYFLPIKTRMPLKFGPEITTEVTCARVQADRGRSPGPAGRRLGRDPAIASSGSGRASFLTRSGTRP